jgi:uncharacterized protein YuzE
MAVAKEYIDFLPLLRDIPGRNVWLSYDEEADVLYINFKKPSIASDSELTEEDIIVRYEGDEILGYTVLHASQRLDIP